MVSSGATAWLTIGAVSEGAVGSRHGVRWVGWRPLGRARAATSARPLASPILDGNSRSSAPALLEVVPASL